MDFNLSKIAIAITKAFDGLDKQYTPDIIDLLALKVTADYEGKIRDGLIGVESIQDSVEDVLVQAGYSDVAKAYILYRKQRENIRNMRSSTPSPTPTYLTGSCSSWAMAKTMPPLAVPSSFVRTMPEMSAVSLNCLA